MHASEETQNRAWVARWRTTAQLLEEVKQEELRALTEEASGHLFAEMTYDTEIIWISPERSHSVGLIEQQRLFMTSHEHPARHQRRS